MKILHTTPPNYPQLCVAFPAIVVNPYVIFAYGDTIYYPCGADLPPYKIAHEEVHGEQQREVGVEWWWEQYILNKEFRLHEEIPAHYADYRTFCAHYADRGQRNAYLKHLAESLSGDLYGNIIGLSAARTLIKYGRKI